MTHNNKQPPDLGEMILASLNGTISAEQKTLLNEQLRQNPDARAFYVDYLAVVIGLRQNLSVRANQSAKAGKITDSVPRQVVEDLAREIQDISKKAQQPLQLEEASRPFESDVFRRTIEQDLHDSAVREGLKKAVLKQEAVEDKRGHLAGWHQRRIPSRRELIIVLVKIAAVICLAVGLIWLDRQLWRNVGQSHLHPVARLTDLMGELKSTDGIKEYDKGLTLFDESYILAQDGMAAITFDNGAQVILEGPVEFSLENRDQMFLQTGKAFAHVPQSAIGFTVDSPSSRMIDLGTDFGVDVWDSGTSELYTYTGQVSLVQGQRGATRQSQIVSAGQARRVDQSTRQVREIQFKPEKFTRRFDSASGIVWRGQPINLADIVGGGNGFGSGVVGTGIDPVTGKAVRQLRFEFRWGTSSYVPVAHNPFIDGVFIPDGGNGPAVVSSTGLLWPECPDTSAAFFADVNNLTQMYDTGSLQMHSIHIRGDGSRRGSVISLHANLGITFDLDAIRKSLPGVRAMRFRCHFGVAEPVSWQREDSSLADARVLVDGVVRFTRTGLTVASGPQDVNLALEPTDRFLTLVTTDGQDLNSLDWVFFVDPILEVESQ